MRCTPVNAIINLIHLALRRDHTQGSGDVTAAFTDYTPAVNMALVKTSFKKLQPSGQNPAASHGGTRQIPAKVPVYEMIIDPAPRGRPADAW